MNLNNHKIIKNYIPFIVKNVSSKTGIPKDEKELIEFCQKMGEQIIKRIEPVNMN